MNQITVPQLSTKSKKVRDLVYFLENDPKLKISSEITRLIYIFEYVFGMEKIVRNITFGSRQIFVWPSITSYPLFLPGAGP